MLEIRSFQANDAGPVRALFATGLTEFAAGYEAAVKNYVQQSLDDDLADILAHYFSHPASHFWVAEFDGQVKGMVGIQYRSDEEAELRRMSVASDTRRQGIGVRLLETSEGFCRRQGYSRIRLTTVTLLQPAIALYQKSGYRLVGEDQYGSISGQHFVKELSGPL